MRGRTHLLVGTAAGVATGIIFSGNSPELIASTIAATMVGSIYPDIDNSKSMLGRKIKPVSYIISKFFGHRGFIHTPFNLFCLFLIFFLPMFFIGDYKYLPILIGFSIGFISHLILDAVTKGGISFLYPFTKKRFNITEMKTGGIGERVFVSTILICIGALAAIKFFV